MLDLDKIIKVTAGGGGIYPGGEHPEPYPVLGQKLGLFNKPDAWGDSNGWMGLLESSNNSINAQNHQRNQQMAVAEAVGTGPLSTKIRSYNFSTNIEQIDGGRIKLGVFKDQTTTVYLLDKINKKIYSGKGDSVSLQSKMFIVSSGNNKYGVSGNTIYSIGDNYEILGIANNITGLSPQHQGVTTGEILGVYGDKVVLIDIYIFSSLFFISYWFVKINEDGSFVELSSGVYEDLGSGSTYMLSAQYGDKIAIWGFRNSVGHNFKTIDITNEIVGIEGKGPITLSNIGNISKVVFDGVDLHILCSQYGALNIYTTSGPTIPGGIESSNIMLGSSILDLQDIDNNLSIINGCINFLGDTSILLEGNIVMYPIIEMQENQTDGDSTVGIRFNYSAKTFIDNQNMFLKIKDNDILSLSNLITDQDLFSINIPLIQNIGSSYIEVGMEITGNEVTGYKLVLGATGGTYSNPTLPADNGMSAGDASTPWVAGNDASYIDLTLSS